MSIWEIIAGPIFKIVDKLIPDPQAKAQAQLQILQMQQAGEFKELETQVQLAKAQTDINQEEAKNPSLFVSGWRPAVGWTCVLGLIYTFIVQPLLSWYSANGKFSAPPALDMGTLLMLLGGMLGLGGMRTVEKINGVAAK